MKRSLLVLLTGCNVYMPGSYGDVHVPGAHAEVPTWPGSLVTLGCLDVAVAVGRVSRVNDPVVTYSFGNRCDHDVTLDLGEARVVARDRAGREIRLAVYDPRREIHDLVMPGRLTGREQIAYTSSEQAVFTQLCIDVGAIDRSAATGERWICEAMSREDAR